MSARRGRAFVYASSMALLLGPSITLVVTNSISRNDRPDQSGETPLSASAVPTPSRAQIVELARRDPMALARLGRERYTQTVRGYRCTLTKQERLPGGMSDVQAIELRVRESPRSVYMIWRTNPNGARRAIWQDEPTFVDKQGRRLVRVEPSGTIVRLLTTDTYVTMDGPDARKTSRRAIADAGFRTIFELLEHYNRIAAEQGVLDLKFSGVDEIAGRPTYVLIRKLPYKNASGPYPDALMILHIDQELLLPVAVFSYADHAKRNLLGSYVFTDIELNPDFEESAFRF